MGKSWKQLITEGMALAFLGITFAPWIWQTNWIGVAKKYLAPAPVEAPAEIPSLRQFLPQWENAQPAPKAEPSPRLIAC